MYRLLAVSILAALFLSAGCASDRAHRRHHAHRTPSAYRVGRNNGSVHHHYAKPPTPPEDKTPHVGK
jgi:hypothetical protein